MRSYVATHGATFHSAEQSGLVQKPRGDGNTVTPSKATKASNWSILLPELAAYGVPIDAATKGRILHGDLPAALEVVSSFKKQLTTRFPPKNHYKVKARVSLRDQVQSSKKSPKAKGRLRVNREPANKKTRGGTVKRSQVQETASTTQVDAERAAPTNSAPTSSTTPPPKYPQFFMSQTALNSLLQDPERSLEHTTSVMEFLVLSLCQSLSAAPVRVRLVGFVTFSRVSGVLITFCVAGSATPCSVRFAHHHSCGCRRAAARARVKRPKFPELVHFQSKSKGTQLSPVSPP